MKLLVINPNSSVLVTENLKSILAVPLEVTLEFYTGPEDSPKEIVASNSQVSAQACLRDLLQKGLTDKYDGYLVCCYSDHPLVKDLAQYTKKPILGIMHASLLYSISRPGKLIIITSVNEWETVLDESINDILGVDTFPHGKFYNTKALDVTVLNLGEEDNFSNICKRIKQILPQDATTVLLGCAGMSGLESKLGSQFPGVEFIDSVKIGVEFLIAIARSKQSK